MPVIKTITYRCLFLLLLLYNTTRLLAQSPARESQIQAAFLFNFTHFVDWPPAAFSSAQVPMIIGVMGKDPLLSFLEQTIAGEKLNDHPLTAKKYTANDDIESCHIIFIDIDDKKKLEQVIAKLKGRSVLTVGDAPDFLTAGGMIRFYLKDNKMQLQVNVEAMKAAGLVISSRLLRQVDIFKQKHKSQNNP